jgi:NitT/TauT family transport system permease protein
VLSIVLILCAWQLLSQSRFGGPLFLPSPAATLAALRDLLTSGTFFSALWISFLRITIATLLSVIIGTVLGVLMGESMLLEGLLLPFTQPIRYLPITALLPLLILWFGIGESMKISFLFLGIVCYFIPLVQNAIRTVPPELIEVAHSFGASRWQTVRTVHIPHALPQMMDGLIVINGLGWTYVILAEIVNAQNGLGYLLYIAGRLQHSADVFATLLLIGCVALGSEAILRLLRHRLFPR